MARLVIPDDFISQFTLLSNIKAKNDADGKANPLTAFLIQQHIDLDDDNDAGKTAQLHEVNRDLFARQRENFRELRDNYFKNVFSNLTGSVQFLKRFYKGNTKQLGTWGITITDSGKIKYPRAFVERLIVFKRFAKKNSSYADGTSPLQPYLTQHTIDLTADAGFAQKAAENNTGFTTKAQQGENETELRNQLWQPVMKHIRTLGNYLMKLYSNNPKALGAWGFVVDESVQKPKLRTSKVKPAQTAVFNGLVIGGTLTNIGTGDIHLYRGKSTAGTPEIISVGKQFGIVKGYSVITIINPSTITDAKLTVLSAH